MTQDLLELIAALREELKQYGGMLALLDQPAPPPAPAAARRPFPGASALQLQAEAILEARRVRETRRRALARELRQDETATIPQLMPLVPPQFRPLLQSLIEENDDLFHSVQRAVREHQTVLNRSAESMERFLQMLFPAEPVAA